MRCNFKVRSKTEFDDGLANVHLEASQTGDVNKEFFRHTPNGYMDLNGINPEIAKNLIVGKEYYLDIIEVE